MKGVFKEFTKNRFSYLFLVPASIYTLVFGYFTLPYMIIAFQKYNFATGIRSPWVGLDNFEFFFVSSRVWEVVRNTLVLNGLFIFFSTIIAVTIALLLNEFRNKLFLRVSQSMMLFPYFLSWVIISYILFALLNTDQGLINNILKGFGVAPIRWYSESQYWHAILTVVYVLKNAGYLSIIYLAAITGFDEGIYEAADIDGASRWQKIRSITIPMLMPVISILILFSIGRIFFADFGMMYALIKDNSMLLPVADVIDTYVFRILRVTGDPSFAMAVGLFQSIVGFLTVFGFNALVRRLYPDGALF